MKKPIKATIQIDETIKIKRLNNSYNKVGFICQSLIPLIDDLIETTKPKFALKRSVKELLRVCFSLDGDSCFCLISTHVVGRPPRTGCSGIVIGDFS